MCLENPLSATHLFHFIASMASIQTIITKAEDNSTIISFNGLFKFYETDLKWNGIRFNLKGVCICVRVRHVRRTLTTIQRDCRAYQFIGFEV